MSSKPKKISGTLEWAVANVNCIKGCSHNCRYCYARSRAMRFKQINTPEDWTKPEVREHDVKKNRKKEDGTVMFPTTHDIVPEMIEPCVIVLRKLLEAGNDILIVSKPHLECIKRLCHEFEEYKDHILFRFTIGAFDDAILKYWEPGAPNFFERMAALKYAFVAGFKTSVSCEPMLDAPNMVELFNTLELFVTDSIWIGKMNKVRQRVIIETEEDERQVARIEAGQTDDKIWEIYEALQDRKVVKWKESVKEIVGLTLAIEPGTDE